MNFSAESFGYNPLDSTGREWYCHPVNEHISQEYSDREATSLDYQVSRCVEVKVTDASSIENNEETYIASHEYREMAWKQLSPSVIRTICKSMYIGASISLFTAGIVGAIYILISYICYKTVHNCEFSLKKEIPVQVQWMRTISASIFCAFLYIWYFTNALFLFRSFQLMGVKRKLILISDVFYFLDAAYQLVIEWFFTRASLAIETRYQNIAVMAAWKKQWKRHTLVAVLKAFPIAIWTSTNLLIIAHGRFNELLSQTSKMPFT